MDKESFFTHFFNGQPIEQVLSAFAWGMIGLAGSVMIELLRSRHKIKAKGGFRFGRWAKDNFYRTLFSVFIIFVGAAYGNDLLDRVGEYGPLALGFMTDKIIEGVLKFKKSFTFNPSNNANNN